MARLSDETREILGPIFGLLATAIDAAIAASDAPALAREGASMATRLLRDQGVILLEGMGATEVISAHVAEIKGTITFE